MLFFATAKHASTTSVVGFSQTAATRVTQSPAVDKEASAWSTCPAATMPGSETTRTRVPPYSRTSSPSRSICARKRNTIRVRGWKSTIAGIVGVTRTFPLIHQTGRPELFGKDLISVSRRAACVHFLDQKSWTIAVTLGGRVAGIRAIPLWIIRDKLLAVKSVFGDAFSAYQILESLPLANKMGLSLPNEHFRSHRP